MNRITDYAEIYRQVKEILSDEANWLKNGDYAVDEYGRQMLGTGYGACRFCFVGAVQNVTGSTIYEASVINNLYEDVLNNPDSYQPGIFHVGICTWNDSPNTPHKDLMDFLDFLIDFYTKKPRILTLIPAESESES